MSTYTPILRKNWNTHPSVVSHAVTHTHTHTHTHARTHTRTHTHKHSACHMGSTRKNPPE